MKKKKNGNFFTGLIGALLGAVVGTLPAALLYGFANIFWGWAFLLIGIAAAFGYRIFKGKKKFGLAFFISLVFSILVPLGYFCYYVMSILADQGIPADQAIEIINDPLNAEFKSGVLSDGFKTILFSIIGVVAAYKPLKVYCADDGADVNTDSVNSIPAQVEFPQQTEETGEETKEAEASAEEAAPVEEATVVEPETAE